MKKAVLRNFAKFTGKHLCLRPATLLKKRLLRRCFPVNPEHLWTTASENYDNAYLLDLLRLDVSSLTKILYLQIQPSEKGIRTNGSIMLSMFYLYGFFRWRKCMWLTIEYNYLLVHKLFEFAVEWISANINKVEIIFGSKYPWHYCITSVNDKKIIIIICIFVVLSSTSVFISN